MTALAFWKAVVGDKSNFLERVLALIEETGFPYCVIGGVAVNAYADPVITLDLDIVLASRDLEPARSVLAKHFRLEEFEHSLTVYDPDSNLQVQIQKDPGLDSLLERIERRDVMDLLIPVASPRDLLRLKVTAALDSSRRASKRQKDLADISRLIEQFPELRDALPAEIRERLFA